MSTEKDPDGAATPYELVQNSAEFAELRRRFRTFAFPMTVAFLAWYLLYVVLSAWAQDFMGHQLVGYINVGIVLGFLQFVSTFGIAWLYARYAAAKLDPLGAELAARIETPEVNK